MTWNLNPRPAHEPNREGWAPGKPKANATATATALRGFGEFHGYRIHTVAQAGGAGAVVEHVA